MENWETKIGFDISFAAELLRKGEVVAIPTETVYGLAANALNPEAVKKIYLAKERPANNPLIVHLSSAQQIDLFAKDIPEIARKLADRFWPGPLTLVLPKKAHIPDIVSAGLPTVGLRVPNHQLTKSLLAILDFPLAAPSANPFGYISPTTAEHVMRQLDGRIPYILDGGNCSQGIESTIVGFEEGNAVIYRFGAIPPEDILEIAIDLSYHKGEKVLAPGMLPYHYSPQTKMDLVDDLKTELGNQQKQNVGLITLSNKIPNIPESQQVQLSPNGDLAEAARNLYQALHKLDAMNLDKIIAEKMPEFGIGLGINDRLMRAAAKLK